ncbi:hypothetical protein QJS04_geneDACA014130 [Acorus gramineus]|uniref:Disease resistance protein At4g27190-like leucine-rich repeats domain-containing protein n=1 Tax=Acorus gramineus TaxID=55184 RepID=A0AAV9B3E3_ACOGR|nr:hypothetical protein QJS04_geneDACA014130 [Acorus gramineus]
MEEAVFQNLEYLSLQYLLKLRSIWQGPKIGMGFTHLKTLIVGGCPELETIFSEEMIENLSCLEELRVFSCPKVKSIIMENHLTTMLQKLTFLVLFSLPELQTICEKVTEWTSLQVMYISNCPKLMKLPRSRSHTVRIIGKPEWWENLKDKGNINEKSKQIFLPV